MNRPLRLLNIRDVEHLGLQLRVSPSELMRTYDGIKHYPQRYYYRRVIQSKEKKRPTATPFGEYRKIVNRLSELLKRLSLPRSMHGGLRGHDTRSYVFPHVGKSTILKTDLKGFFPNVRPSQVYQSFLTLGCSPDVSRIITRFTTLDGCLPQGSPTSSLVGNIVTAELAKRLGGLARKHGAVVTTYIDDIALSGGPSVGNLKRTVKKIIRQSGFAPNLEKTMILDSSREQVVAGIRVNSQLDVPSAKLSEIRKLLRNLEADVSSGTLIESRRVRSLSGKIRYVSTLNRGAGRVLEDRLRNIVSRLDDRPS